MATHTLPADTSLSTLTIEDGDTIALNGHTLFVDTDASATALSFSGTGILHLKNGGGILVGAAVPATVTVESDELPVRGSLDFNAAAVVKYADYSYLRNIPKWTVPTAAREGALWAKVATYTAATLTVTLDRDIPSLAVGDALWPASAFTQRTTSPLRVTAVDHENLAVTLESVPDSRNLAAGDPVCCVSAPLLVYSTSTSSIGPNNNLFNGDWTGGDVLFSGAERGIFGLAQNSYRAQLFGGRTKMRRVSFVPDFVSSVSPFADVAGPSARIFVGTVVSPSLKGSSYNAAANSNSVSRIDEVVCQQVFGASGADGALGTWSVRKITASSASYPSAMAGVGFCVNEADIPAWSSAPLPTSATVQNGTWITAGGTATATADGFFFAPATSDDIAWRYTDRTVAPGATLRLRCAWLREGGYGTRASVAVTDPATWWPQWWPLGAEAPASVELAGGTADLRSELLTWRNTGTEAATVRVWECVTGTVGGGYLKVEEVKGGAL